MTCRRHARVLSLIAVLALQTACTTPVASPSDFTVGESSILDLQRQMETGELTSRELVTAYLTRIALYEDRLNGAISVNPNALA